MHSIYLGIWAFINAAGGSPPSSSEAVACSLTEFILGIPAPLLSTLRHWEHPPLLGALEDGERQRKQKSRVLLGSVVSQLTGSLSSSVPQCMKPCGPPHLSPLPWGCWWGGGKTGIYPLRVFLKATQRVSGGARMRAERLLAPRPLHDSELASEARGLGKVSFVYLESSVFCFPFKAREPHDDSECMQECACTPILVPGSVMPASN